MARKTPTIEGQEPLFIGGQQPVEYGGGSYHSWQEVEQNPSLKIDPNVDPAAPSNPIDSRAFYLDRALTNLGKANQRVGFSIAAEVQPHSGEIWKRYRSETPRIVEGAQNNIEGFINDAKKDFWRATGLTALIAARMISEREAKARAQQMWHEFSHRFSAPSNAAQKEELRKSLRKQIRAASSK